ncbi:MAG: hypothetical protein COA78_36015 [Blastopirellula sp.]|nr:MAG: hypothetical protein COA78_36015 [Blastopirellula sp.]
MTYQQSLFHPTWIGSKQAVSLSLTQWLPKRYHKHLDQLNSEKLPLCLYDKSIDLCLLIKKGPALNRAIIIISGLDNQSVAKKLNQLLTLVELKCLKLGRTELTLRCPVSPLPQLFPSNYFQQLLPDRWSEADYLQTYYCSNFHQINKPLKWFLREYGNNNNHHGTQIVPWKNLITRSNLLEKVQQAAPLEPELWPQKHDFETRFSYAAVEQRKDLLDYDLLGWMIVSRRQRGLLYNRLFVIPERRNFSNLGTRLVAAAIFEQQQQEPETASILHVSQDQPKLAKLYKKFIGPWCDQFEENWVSHLMIPDAVSEIR